MPQIPQEYVDSVVVLLSGPVGHEEATGTGFVMSVREDDLVTQRFFLVTCEHCRAVRTVARFNTKHTLEIGYSDWTASPDGADVMAYEITGWMGKDALAIGHINDGSIVQDHTRNFGVGVDLFMLGLLANETDRGTNVPVARSGTLAARAHADFPITQGNEVVLPTHLADMRSRGGFSGSPVFGYWQSSAFSDIKFNFGFLGVHSGQYGDQVKVHLAGIPQTIMMPSSVTKIVPAWYLIPLLVAARR
jgi:hypothetical protein